MKKSPWEGNYVKLSTKKLRRLVVIQKHIEGLITINEAAEILGLSSRQVKKLKKGDQWLLSTLISTALFALRSTAMSTA
ncbi:helix-turn-helix domain-containing protein [Syntrophothermus lipocalidus]|uniref:helix-turn-helix domain-containing protein n=1 Tax=Syntrophothermus lipocalidus TaxID=86170 RepID=UPI003BF7D58D